MSRRSRRCPTWMLIVAFIATGCSGGTVENTQTILVETTDNRALRDLQSKVDAASFRQLANSRSAVLELKESQVAELQSLRLPHFEVSAGRQLDLLPLPGPQDESLDAAQSSILAALTNGLAATEFQVTAERPIELSRDILNEQNLALGLPLPGQPSVRVLSRQTRTEAGLLVWEAALEGGGEARIVSDREGLSGIVRRLGATYSIESLGGGRQVIIRENPARFRDHPPALDPPQPTPSGRPPEPQACADPIDKVRVLFAYSDTLASSNTSVATKIVGAILETNDSFVKSGIAMRIELAGQLRVNYREDINLPFQRHYAVLMDRSDGVADGVPAARDSTSADLVILLVQDARWCGDAGSIYPPVDRAYAVTALSCAAAYWSLAHEIGHLAGARHDDDSESRPYSYGHGHLNLAHQWRTIMASEKKCKSCQRIPHWSNPQVSYSGQGPSAPTGVVGISEEARVLTQEAPRLARYRCGSGSGQVTFKSEVSW